MPIVLLAYLGVMAWFGYKNEHIGTAEYFAVLGITTLVIVLLYFTLRRKEKLKDKNKDTDIK